MKPAIILATTSPYKKKVFTYLNIPFRSIDSKVDESVIPRKNPKKLVLALSRLKAKAVANYSNGIIIGLDSIGYFKGRFLEKQRSKQDSLNRLKMISGKTFYSYTGICIIAKSKTEEKIYQRVVKTKVRMRILSDKEIRDYVNSDPNILKYCIGFDPELGLSSSFVKSIKGSYNNLLNGMPIEAIKEMLDKI